MTRLKGKLIPLEAVFPEQVYILMGVQPNYKYDDNNQKTEEVVGYTYHVVNTEDYEQIKVKVPHQIPLITQDELMRRRNTGEKISVEFTDAFVKLYWSSYTRQWEDSFSAGDIRIIH